jgi:phosphoenolpyruvate carboxykinase (GTP)
LADIVKEWVEEQARLTKPERIHWIQGTEEEMRVLTDIGMHQEKIGVHHTFQALNPAEFPNSYLHRSHPTDVARTEHLTFVCLPNKEDAGPNNNWMDPNEARRTVLPLFDGCMKGRTMYVIPYMMGHPDSPYARPCVQITDSVYVAVSMYIMTRASARVLDIINSGGNFVKGLHSIGDLNPQRRYIMHFPQEDLVMSIGSGYGGNALLGKKCISLRIASYLGRQQGWLAEHMIIMGVQDPEGDITYMLGSFPSACGKTNLAMLEPVTKGYKVWTLGDDIAWINPGPDGRLYAINPEAGFFGVAPGTSDKTNPNMMKTLRNNRFYPTLFTNTGLRTDTNGPWWEGLTESIPEPVLDWQGRPHVHGSGESIAHPNSRFTVSIYNCPTLSPEVDNPRGVPISGILFGGRRSTTIPLVCESLDWEHGVFRASANGSETTAAATGKAGVVRRDPMAMLPFCGYNMGDYFAHWLNVGSTLPHPPKIFFVNWFKKDDEGRFIWPGFRDNSRIIKWMVDRIKGKVQARESAVGLMPYLKDIDMEGLSLSEATMDRLFEVNKDEWRQEIEEIRLFYTQFGAKLPDRLKTRLAELSERIEKY